MIKIREFIRLFVIKIRFYILKNLYGMDLHDECRISFGAKLDKTHPQGIHIGKESYVTSGVIIFSHDFSRDLKLNTHIGERCFIGANAIIMAGVRVGDEVVIGAGSIVTKDVPPKSIVVGNPAKVIKKNISTAKFGQLVPGQTLDD